MFDQLGKQQQMNPIQELKNDPAGFLKSKGFNIPDDMKDPRSITSYLLQSGQVGGQRMQMAQQMIQRMMRGR